MSLQYKPATAIRMLKKNDPVMADLIGRVGPFKLQTEFDVSPFQALLRAIVYQQLAGHAAAAIYARVLVLFDDPLAISPAELLALDPDALRTAGLSKAKVVAVLDLATKRLQDIVPSLDELVELDDAEIVDRLTQVRGVGQWTVEIMLIYRLGRSDVLPVTDLGIRKGYQLAYGGADLPAPRQLATLGAIWKPYRSVASWYLWRATDSVEWSNG